VAASRTGRAVEAVRELRLVLERLSAAGAPAIRTAEARIALGFLLLESGEIAEASVLFRDALDLRHKHVTPEHPAIAEAECSYGLALSVQGNAEGRSLIEKSWPRYRAWGFADPVYMARIRAVLAHE